jgi:DNA-binding transcriptional LysR family regulator
MLWTRGSCCVSLPRPPPRSARERRPVALVYPDRRLLKPSVRAFVDHAAVWFEQSSLG